MGSMTYVVLARRWRPQGFDEVIGQGHVTRTLKNAITQGRIAHAYLFSGPRGVGKTTVARILAKALNCERGVTQEPCGICSSCKEITQGGSMDVQEIDGASHTSVENIREIREGLKYRPSKGRYRVYIIDEVHMLSTSAFNALLKTLEEPPPHVVFVFATTEVHKIPATVLSRCQRFDFRRIPLAEMVGHLDRICHAEGIHAEAEVLALVAREAQGSLRDAQSLLDQLVAYAGTNIDFSAAREVIGVLDRRWLHRASRALVERDPGACLQLVDELFGQGESLHHFYYQLVEHLRNILVAKLTPGATELLGLPDHEVAELCAQAAAVSVEDLQLWFDILVKAEEEMRKTAYPRYVLEMLLVKMATLERTTEVEELLRRLGELAQGLAGQPQASLSAAHLQSSAQEKPLTVEPLGATGISQEDWRAFLAELRAKRPGLASVLEQGRFMGCSGPDVVRLAFPSSFHLEMACQGEHGRALEAMVREHFGRRVRIAPVLEGHEAGRENGARDQRLAQVEARSHPMVQKAVELLGARVVEVRIAPGSEAAKPPGGSGGEA